MHASASRFVLALALSVPLGVHSFAQTDGAAKEDSAPKREAVDSAQNFDPTDPKSVVDELRKSTGIEWQMGPSVGRIGTIAEIQIPEGFVFTEARGTKKFMELTHNPSGPAELGTMLPIPNGTDMWFVVFSYESIGHVKDDERDKLDADALLSTLKEGTERSNEERERRGWGKLELVGWEKPPFYDPKTNNLTWATIGRSTGGAGKDGEQGETHAESVNWSTRLLGRTGAMSVDLVLSKEQLPTVLPAFDKLIAGYSFVSGERYAEFRAGDKVAEYGLAALVAGGAGLVAAKTGLLGKLLKPLAIGLVAIAAFFRRMWSRLFGRKNTTSDSSS